MNQTKSVQSSPLMMERLFQIREKSPEFLCFQFLNRLGEIEGQITIEEWLQKAQTMASIFKFQGIEPKDRVLVALPTSEEFLVVFLGLWWIGAIPVPVIKPSTGPRREGFRERFIHVIEDCSPKGIIFQDEREEIVLEFEGKTSSPVSVWSWKGLWVQNVIQENELIPIPAQENDIAFIQYTSGSTGNPKGVVITQGNLRANVQAIGLATHINLEGVNANNQPERLLNWMPLYHDMGLIGGVFFNSYHKVPCLLLSPTSFLSNPQVWLKSIHRYQITLSTGNNFAYHLCARLIKPERIPGLDLSSWRLAYNGSEPISISTLRGFCDKFTPYGFKETTLFPVYGMAEGTLAITLPTPGEPLIIDRVRRKELLEEGRAVVAQNSEENVMELVATGPCIPGHSLLIKKPFSDQILKEREIGEICFYGPSVSPDYYKESTAPSAFGKELRTGDLGYLAEGNLYIVDRLKDVIQIAGTNYFPSDIEREILQLPGIYPGRVVAFDIPDPQTGTNALVIVAAITSKGDKDFLPKEIKNRLFSAYGLVPRTLLLVNKKSIPLTSSGKITRRKCRELFLKGELNPST